MRLEERKEWMAPCFWLIVEGGEHDGVSNVSNRNITGKRLFIYCPWEVDPKGIF